MKISNFGRKIHTLMGIIAWSVLEKQNQQAKKVYCFSKQRISWIEWQEEQLRKLKILQNSPGTMQPVVVVKMQAASLAVGS